MNERDRRKHWWTRWCFLWWGPTKSCVINVPAKVQGGKEAISINSVFPLEVVSEMVSASPFTFKLKREYGYHRWWRICNLCTRYTLIPGKDSCTAKALEGTRLFLLAAGCALRATIGSPLPQRPINVGRFAVFRVCDFSARMIWEAGEFFWRPLQFPDLAVRFICKHLSGKTAIFVEESFFCLLRRYSEELSWFVNSFRATNPTNDSTKEISN